MGRFGFGLTRTMMMTRYSRAELAVVFDLDGTVIDSEAIKKEAFSSLFWDSPHYAEIKCYNESNRGVPRKVKFEYVFKEILKSDHLEQNVNNHLNAYAKNLETMLLNVPVKQGFVDFARMLKVDKFVASSAPLKEVVEQLERLHIRDFFREVFGYPVAKVSALKRINQQYKELIFIGDSMADYEAAHEANVHFVGICEREHNPFIGLDIVTFSNYGELGRIIRRISEKKTGLLHGFGKAWP
ncbi:MAG: HAD family hydrolase [Trueperaceae bacterium]